MPAQNLQALTEPASNYLLGHIASLRDNSDQPVSDIATQLTNNPGIDHFQRRWDWGEFETAKGVYDFTGLHVWLDALSAADPTYATKLLVHIEDRSFTGSKTIASISTATAGNPVTITFTADHKAEDGEHLVLSNTNCTPPLVGQFKTTYVNDTTVTIVAPFDITGAGTTGTAKHSCVPIYIHDEGYNWTNSSSAYGGKRFSTYYMERMFDLYRALYDSVKDHPSFGGLATQETSTGYTQTTPADFHELYRDATFLQQQYAAQVFFEFPVYWFQNFLGNPTPGDQYLNSIWGWLQPYRPVMCGPDILPNSWSLTTRVYPRFQLYPAGLHSNSIQNDSYESDDGAGGYMTMTQVWNWGVQNLNIISCLWNQRNWDSAAGYQWEPEGAAVVNNPANAIPWW